MPKTINCCVMSGGGARGSLQVGMLEVLSRRADIFFDIITGVSVGALNGSLLSQGSNLREQQGKVKQLDGLYSKIRSPRDIYVKRGIAKYLDLGLAGDVAGALGKNSLYDTAPLKSLIYKHVQLRPLAISGVAFRVGVASLLSGEYRAVPQSDPQVRDYILASASIPMIFNPIQIGADIYVDGGVRNVTPLSDAIHALKGRYKDGDEVNMYVLLTTPLAVDEMKPEQVSGFPEVMIRAIDLMVAEIYLNDLMECEQRNANDYYIPVNAHVVAPEKNVLAALDFYPDHLRAGYEYGKELAEEFLQSQERGNYARD
jgi:predicted patatin/cPLA2 family phospholipase